MDYKDTLFMGKTDFEMRGNLNTKSLTFKRNGMQCIYMKRF